MRTHLVRMTAIAGLAVATSIPAAAQGNWQPGDFGSIRFRLGLFEPDGESVYWQDKFRDFTGNAAEFEDTSIGIDYQWHVSRDVAIMFGTSFYNGATTQAYRDWVDADGREIRHVTDLDMSDLSAILVWRPFPRGSVSPYVGAGGGLLWWRLNEGGDFIDFGDPDMPIVPARYRSDGTTWELLLVAGFDVPLGYRWSFFGEGRWRDADDELDDGLAGLGNLDLSGVEYTAGVSWRF